MDRKVKRTGKTDARDSDTDADLPPEPKRTKASKEKQGGGPGQLDTSAEKGSKRKRPVPKELKKRKKPKTDEGSDSEVDDQSKEKERKGSKAGEKAKSNARHDTENDRIDSASTRSDDSGHDRVDDDLNSASEEDDADEEEPMDYAEEATEDISNETQPEGSKPQRGNSMNFQSVRQELTRPHKTTPITQHDTTASDQKDNAPRLTGNKAFSPRRTEKKVNITQESYYPTSRQRYSQQSRQDSARYRNQTLSSVPPGQRSFQTLRTYTSSSVTSRNMKEGRTSGLSKEAKTSSHGHGGCRKYCLILIFLAAFVVAIFAYVIKNDVIKMDDLPTVVKDVGSSVFSSECVKRMRSERFDILMQEQDNLLKQYPSLDESALPIIAGASFDHVNDHHELARPVVLLLVGKDGGKTNVNDVAHSVATMYANVFSSERHENDVVGIVGAYLEESSADEVKKEVESHIEKGFSGCSSVALITDVDKLPPCSATMFHAYCDNDSAPHKDAVFIFTLTLNAELKENAPTSEVEKAVQAQLSDSWSRCPEEFSAAKIVAMHSRVANNIVII
ncbi:torsin-1A-interacting protein 1-like [Lytechinus variegatus]|uniref:torsin-1A-interacting protein 1-like n=1 Tax=Lytechinus variegatus TaxID=7654 RepID=UPI001BB231ED|nr:torsin-1A-interacting protein 1-like [Lytechinus variegatus]